MEVSGQLHVPAALPPETKPGTHRIGGWVVPRAGLGSVAKGKMPAGNRTPHDQPKALSLYYNNYSNNYYNADSSNKSNKIYETYPWRWNTNIPKMGPVPRKNYHIVGWYPSPEAKQIDHK
jgi:hypothetical protein